MAGFTDDDRPYKVQRREIIAETEELAVKLFTLSAEQEVPWHYHSRITDSFFCQEGVLSVETREPKNGTPAIHHLLQVGERCAVPPGVPHRVRGQDGSPCRFLIVQGVGIYDYIPA